VGCSNVAEQGGPLEVRVHCDEPLMLCVLLICSDVNPIYV
jgi:hypothetical protein